jgi:hypothetical protein
VNPFLARIADVDPDTGRVRCSAFGRHHGQSRTRTVLRETDGKVGGTTTEHWSGRVDAKVTGFDVTVNPNITAHFDRQEAPHAAT